MASVATPALSSEPKAQETFGGRWLQEKTIDGLLKFNTVTDSAAVAPGATLTEDGVMPIAGTGTVVTARIAGG
jgi:N-acetylglucosamine kinase-like BadF-type ATPase